MQQMHEVRVPADSKPMTAFVPLVGHLSSRRGTANWEADSSTMGRRHQLLDAPGESLAARPDAAQKDERKQ